jgi:hypothetical protein
MHEMTDKELLELAAQMRNQGDLAGLLHLNAVLTVALYVTVGRRIIFSDLTLSGLNDAPERPIAPDNIEMTTLARPAGRR